MKPGSPNALRRALAAALALAALFGAAASAQVGEDSVPPPPDSDLTPVAKRDEAWKQVAGAEFGDKKVMEGSPTTFDTDFFTVAFRNPRLGLAGGSACGTPPSTPEAAASCQRVPVIYRYVEERTGKAAWTKATLPGGADPGFVGAVAWVDHRRAVAVGGDGCYPRREEPCPDGSTPPGADPAGLGRAWLYDVESDDWTELDLSQQRAQGMGGMTALDFDPGSEPAFGAAGAYGQIWEWRDDAFVKKVDKDSPATDIYAGQLFRHRVRDLRFYTDPPGSGIRPQAFGVTAGCCELNAIHNTPRLLAYGSRAGGGGGGAPSGPHRWYVRRLGLDPRERVDSEAAADAAQANGQDVPNEVEEEIRGPWRANVRPDLPDSFYSLGALRISDEVCAIASPGGPESPDERSSVLTAGQNVDAIGEVTPTPLLDAALTVANETTAVPTRGAIGSARLVAADGAAEQTANDLTTTGSRGCAPNWMVGELRASRLEGLGARGLLVATHRAKPKGMKVKGWDFLGTVFRGGVDVAELERPPDLSRLVEDQDNLLKPLESSFYAAPTYSLNDVQMVRDSGSGWAVGDHGAIVTTSEAESPTPQTEPDPPRLGSRARGELPDLSPYEPFAPLGERALPGLVPEQFQMPRGESPEYGYQDLGRLGIGTIEDVLISPDGDEGLALGAGGKAAYYDGNGWFTCATAPVDQGTGAGGCRGEALAGGGFEAATRVPLERDDDPANDEEFEVFALTDGGPLRYRHGRWRREDPAALAGVAVTGFSVAFSAPDHGWAVAGAQAPYSFFRFDGERWHACTCDPGKRIPRAVPGNASTTEPRGGLAGLAAAGDRVYAFGFRVLGTSWVGAAVPYPLILYRRAGDEGWSAEPGSGGYDPGFEQTDPLEDSSETGLVTGLAVVEHEGGYTGWAVGAFGGGIRPYSTQSSPVFSAETPLLRLGDGGWQRFADTGPMSEYLNGIEARLTSPGGITDADQMLVSREGSPDTIAQSSGRVYQFNDQRRRFELLPLNRRPAAHYSSDPSGSVAALEPDRHGGHYAAVGESLFHWTDSPRAAVFREVPRPSSDTTRPITAIAGAPDGTVWASTGTDVLYRYSRVAGWNRARIPGWDVGRIVTAPAPLNAIAVGRDGDGLAVGKGGRIARLSAAGAELDPAAGTMCDVRQPVAPCSTSRDLHSVEIAPDGSALAGGDRAALLWRPPGGEFRAVARPDVPISARITAISMPAPDRAWLTTDGGLIFIGHMSSPGGWSWELENLDDKGDALKIGRLHAIEVGTDGHGYALSESETLLERTSGELPWQPVAIEGFGGLRSLAFPVGDGQGTLIGTSNGSILTRHGESFRVARPSGGWASAAINSLVLLPGVEDAEVEAWALEGRQRLLHYASDSADPLLQPLATALPLADAPAERPDEITVAAFGKSDCHSPSDTRCAEMAGLTGLNEVIVDRIRGQLAQRVRRGTPPALALFTGDAVDGAGYPGNAPATSIAGEPVADDVPQGVGIQLFFTSYSISANGSRKVRRFGELVGNRFADAQVPLLAAIGGRDLAAIELCEPAEDGCDSTADNAQAGDNVAWRQALADQAAPWGGGDLVKPNGFVAAPLGGGLLTQRLSDPQTPDPDGDGGTLRARQVPAGGASTHYALDLVDGGDRAAARIVFLDSSLRALSAADHQQQPLEPAGGQLAWLESMLCFEGDETETVERCTRKADQQAIVVSNTPTYSYGPGIGTQTATDAATLETALLRHRANLVVSGRIGWNGMYWATAPGVHEPCPGEDYPSAPPEPGRRLCGQAAAPDGQDPLARPEARPVADALLGTAAPVAPLVEDVNTATDSFEGALPFVVASGGGGPLAGEDPTEGFWYGYTLVRLDASGDPRKTIVEQRPVYDWIGIEAQGRALRPGQRMTLRGFGRVPDGTYNNGRLLPIKIDRISGPGSTHRYDLLLADPDRPWVPYRDANGDYVPLNASVARIDRATGVIRAGRGRGERTYAVGMLSMGEMAATYPLVFEPRRSFALQRARLTLPPVPRAARAPGGQAPMRIAEPPALPPAQPPPTAAPPVASQTLQPPEPPAIPSLPTANAPSAPAPPSVATPPAPPAPPPASPAPPSQQPQPLGLGGKLQPVAIVPSVNPPAPPPVNPAPPAGSAARKEAKQRQAATAKSEEGASGQAAENGGDLAQGGDTPTGVQMTRRAVDRPAPSFTALPRGDQPSAWARGIGYGGGLGLAALAFAAAWTIGRPRRRSPELPAMSFVRDDRL